MAAAALDTCEICANSFNTDFYRSVSLPCNHVFCLLCLVRLRASGKNNCPTCRRNWAGFEVPTLPGMETLTTTMQADQDDEEEMSKEKCMFERCEKHSRHFDFWVNDIQEFFCVKCATENPHVKLELIEEVIPQIKATLEAEVANAEKKVQNDMESLDKRHAEIVSHRNTVRKFIKAAEVLDDNFKREIEEITGNRSKALDTTAELKNTKRKLCYLRCSADIHRAVECKSILKGVDAPSSVPKSDLPNTLLCNIAHSYLDEAATANPPCKASFVDAVQKYGIRNSPETVAAAEQLKGGKEWTVDNKNCEAALQALADRQPSVLRLAARDDAREALLVAAVARAAKGCEVEATFVDTFYLADNSATDAARLEHLTANQSLRLASFLGHLNHSAIAKLPHTISGLGLAIGNATEAAAVSSLRPWEGLGWLSVSVSSRVAAKDLKPLPSGPYKILYFPFLSDACVDSVRHAIEALAPDLRIWSLYFPKSELTAAGFRHLAQRLRGVTIKDWVTIEASGSWWPGAGEKKSAEDELRSATGCNGVEWDMKWIYGYQSS